MKAFLDDDFLLENNTAKKLYYDYAAKMPIIDYHSHLPPEDIAADRKFHNLTEIWLEGDHYKWRAMRANGVAEHFITGDSSPSEKFQHWAETVPYTLRNPLYHWTHLELRRYFNISTLLDGMSANAVYRQAGEHLSSDDYSTRNLIQRMNVEVICTTDDPADNLEHHQGLRKVNWPVKVLPTFRPDKSFAAVDPIRYHHYLEKLESASGRSIDRYADLLQVLQERVDYFHQNGCRLADHGLERLYPLGRNGRSAERAFEKVRAGQQLSNDELHQLQQETLLELGKMYHAKSWTQQFHLGALRNTNTRMMNSLGPDTGFDAIGDYTQGSGLASFLDALDSTDQLAKTIVYNLNPGDNELLATIVGSFNDGDVAGKMQLGSGWWFLDQKNGMTNQLNALSNMGLLRRFVGMLTDSRSFMSFPRHEYFRRILCNLIGTDVERGELPNDLHLLGKMAQDICYYNAKTYFGFDDE